MIEQYIKINGATFEQKITDECYIGCTYCHFDKYTCNELEIDGKDGITAQDICFADGALLTNGIDTNYFEPVKK